MQCLEEERYLKKDSNIGREISATLLSSSVPLKDFIIDKNTPNGSRLQSIGRQEIDTKSMVKV